MKQYNLDYHAAYLIFTFAMTSVIAVTVYNFWEKHIDYQKSKAFIEAGYEQKNIESSSTPVWIKSGIE